MRTYHPTATDRRDNGIEVIHLVKYLERHGTLSRNNIQIIGWMNKYSSRFLYCFIRYIFVKYESLRERTLEST